MKVPPIRETQPLLTIPDVAMRLAVSTRHVWQLLSTRTLTPIRLGRRVTRILAAEVEALIEAGRQRGAR